MVSLLVLEEIDISAIGFERIRRLPLLLGKGMRE